ncbi:MAG: hypothetical protein AAF217_08365 [Pseudomonadota bacterium]
MIVLSALGRLLVICLALLVAMLAGSLFIGFGLISGMFPELLASDGSSFFNDPDADFAILTVLTIGAGFVASIQLAGLALLPVTIAIAITELMRWQGMTVHLVLGGLCGLFTILSVFSLPTGQVPSQGTIMVSLATGFVSAFFYWLIAGRNAGNWLEEKADA